VRRFIAAGQPLASYLFRFLLGETFQQGQEAVCDFGRSYLRRIAVERFFLSRVLKFPLSFGFSAGTEPFRGC